MATESPTPTSSPSAVPPSTTNPPLRSPSPPLGPSTTSPPPPPNTTTVSPSSPATPSAPSLQPPTTSPSSPAPIVDPPTSSSPPISSPPPSPPATPPSSPPPPPPLSSPPLPLSSPPPPTSSSPPLENSPPPPALPSPPQKSPSPPPPPPSSEPPKSSAPPPPSSEPPKNSPPPPPSSEPPKSSPPLSPNPPKNSTSSPPPPPSPKTPQNSPPPPSPPTPSEPPTISPPPPQIPVPPPRRPPPPSIPPTSSPPPKASNSPPSPASITPTSNNPPPSTPFSPSNSTPNASPSAPLIRMSPPPPSVISPPSSDNNTIPVAPDSSNSKSGGIGTVGIVAIGVVVGVVMLSLVGLAVWCMKKRRKEALGSNDDYVMPSPPGSSQRTDSNFTKTQTTVPLIGSGSSPDFVYSSGSGGLGNSRSWFTYEELLKATNGFSSQNLLGKGGFGSVYKGCLQDGREVAVKQLKVGGGQGEREFKAEVEIISRIHHRHLVSLVGYCISDSQRMLVYDYVPNDTLHFHLHGEGKPILDWAARVKIATGAARGIAYLHEDCYPRIIHRDIKSSNILLDNNFEAKVADFGLAKLNEDANTHVTTRVIGTFGYMAPEYASSGKLTEKSDVFSYGVVLLELITGRKPVDASQPLGDESLVQWARPLLSHAVANEEFDGLVDPRLEKNYVESEMFTMIEVAAACVRHSATKRPCMGQIVRAFESLAMADLCNGMRVGESQIFNSAQQSAEIRLYRRMAFGSQDYSTDFFSQIRLES